MKLSDISLEKYKSGELFETVPHFEILKNVIENDTVHNNDSVYSHTLSVAENIISIVSDSPQFEKYFGRIVADNSVLDLLVTAALFHDTGKAAVYTVNEGATSCEGHEEVSYQIISDFFKNVEGDKSEKELVKEIVGKHAAFYPYLNEENRSIVSDFNLLRKNLALYPELLLFCAADIRGSQLKENDIKKYSFQYSFVISKLEEYLK